MHHILAHVNNDTDHYFTSYMGQTNDNSVQALRKVLATANLGFIDIPSYDTTTNHLDTQAVEENYSHYDI